MTRSPPELIRAKRFTAEKCWAGGTLTKTRCWDTEASRHLGNNFVLKKSLRLTGTVSCISVAEVSVEKHWTEVRLPEETETHPGLWFSVVSVSEVIILSLRPNIPDQYKWCMQNIAQEGWGAGTGSWPALSKKTYNWNKVFFLVNLEKSFSPLIILLVRERRHLCSSRWWGWKLLFFSGAVGSRATLPEVSSAKNKLYSGFF